MGKKEIYIGLDVGTNSVGYAVTDEEYNLLKHRGNAMWGSHVFEEGNTKAERRAFRSARRRLDRRQQRIHLTQEIFAKEISKVDEQFFIRLKESALFREDTSINSKYSIFDGDIYNDVKYHEEYPTIHHLICSLIEDKSPKDVRLVYIAIAWLMGHRGHFNSEVDKNNISNVLDFEAVYSGFNDFFETPLWDTDIDEFKNVLLKRISITRKESEFLALLNDGKKFKDGSTDRISKGQVVKLLSGGSVKLEKLFLNEEYSQLPSIRLGMDDVSFQATISELDDEAELLLALRAIYDWGLLAEILDLNNADANKNITISASKVKVYEQHKADLKNLKSFVKKYCNKDKYDKIFRSDKLDNYVAYSGHEASNRCDKVKFSDFLKKELKNIDVNKEDQDFYTDMMDRIEIGKFLPKQVDNDNRVIPYQLYWHELDLILKNAKEYLPFLSEKDSEGYENAQKIMSNFEFKIPYFVGPLRTDNTKNGWMVRKTGMTGKIYSWNFEKMVDLDASEQAFINRMTNTCSYLPSEDVLPKCSLLYSKFMVLNEINNIKVNGAEIPVEVKQQIFNKFKEYKKVTKKRIEEVLISNACMKTGDVLSGIDDSIKSSLGSYHSFKKLLERKELTEENVEDIIKHITYSEDSLRLRKWIDSNYPNLSEDDKKYISRLKFNDFGRLSGRLLTGIEGINKKTGEITSIIDALWNTNDNLMQLLSEKYTFINNIEEEREVYYNTNKLSLDEILDNMYISNSVKRPIYRTLSVLSDIRKATKQEPKRIFLEMARGGGEKGNRTKSRRSQIEELYSKFKKEEVRELSKQLEGATDNELQSETLFLYFTQMGRCMYSGETISIDELKTSKYNVDHIFPQSKVKDDSIDNKVLVLSSINGLKSDIYPLDSSIRNKMHGFWTCLKDKDLISKEKFKRLTRSIGFDEEELRGFIKRQLVETTQSTKALATIIKNMYPNTEVVYVKAGLVSDFRKECLDVLKSRTINDLHHGKDAYLNIVCGNVYYCRFTKKFYIDQEYSLKTKTLFTQKVSDGSTLVWNGGESIAKVRKNVTKNTLHYTRFAFERKGGLFDQMPVKAGGGAVARKKGMPIEKYGGYNKSTATYFLLVKYLEKKKTDILFMPVDLWAANALGNNEELLKDYSRKNIANILGKSEAEISIQEFPLGLRKIKINTIVEVDGFKISITGKSSGGIALGITIAESLKLDYSTEQYVKKLEKFIEKKNNGIISSIDSKYDKITKERNLELYEKLKDKVCQGIYHKVLATVQECVEDSNNNFETLSLEEQTETLMNLISVFKSGRAGGCDLRKIGGKEKSAVITMSTKLSNWSKKYSDVRIVDISPSGIYESKSDNLLGML